MTTCLETLVTDTAEAGFALAMKLSRMAVNFQTIAAANAYWR
ncbi:hexameric tyrosine-coordinated heme protein [Novosphingobium sp.]|nr:hexameric tyrosine-coordinated heme protein [Novosphingobium sp.]